MATLCGSEAEFIFFLEILCEKSSRSLIDGLRKELDALFEIITCGECTSYEYMTARNIVECLRSMSHQPEYKSLCLEAEGALRAIATSGLSNRLEITPS